MPCCREVRCRFQALRVGRIAPNPLLRLPSCAGSVSLIVTVLPSVGPPTLMAVRTIVPPSYAFFDGFERNLFRFFDSRRSQTRTSIRPVLSVPRKRDHDTACSRSRHPDPP